MELAKMTSKGQLTVPKAVREDLELAPGKRVVFVKRGNDWVMLGANQPRPLYKAPVEQDPNDLKSQRVLLDRMLGELVPDYRIEQINEESVAILAAGNSPLGIIRELHQAFQSVAESSGWDTEQDVVDYIKKLRRGEV